MPLPPEWTRTSTWVTNRPHNNVHVVVTSMDNGQAERIWYTSVMEKTPETGEFEHVQGSSLGHGYGVTGGYDAMDRAERLVEGEWARFTKIQPDPEPEPEPEPVPKTAWDRLNDED